MESFLNKKNQLGIISILGLFFTILSFLSIMISNNYVWVILFMNTYLSIGFIIHDRIRTKKILTYGIFFNVLWWLYSSIYFIEISVHSSSIREYDYMLALLSIISMICFNLAYYFNLLVHKKNSFSKFKIGQEYNLRRLRDLLLIMLSITLLVQLYIIFIRVGFSNYVFTSRAGRSALIKPFRWLMFYQDWLILISVISYYLKTISKEKVISLMFYVSFLNSIFNSVIMISRADLLMLILPIVFIALNQKKISNKQVIVVLFTILGLFVVWKALLSGIIFNQQLIFESGNFNGEFTTWYTIGNNVFSDLFQGNMDFLLGKSYFDTLKNLIVPFTNSEPLSVWYVRTYEIDVFLRGGGRGFSGIVEGFLNFSFLGNMLYFGFLGAFFKKIEMSKYIDSKYLIIYAISLPYVQRIFRSESYSLFKTWFWFYILIILLLFKLCEVTQKSKTIINIDFKNK